jgi:CyaY protein
VDEATFDKLGRDELAYIEEQLDEVDPDDIDVTSTDGVLTLTLRDGARVVINTHRAARQIWMAAVASAWHFNPPSQGGDRWQTADGTELHDTLARVVKERIGLELQL